jgi:hypothetical protein
VRQPKDALTVSFVPPAAVFAERLNEQTAHEFAAHQQYVACAVVYDGPVDR